MQSYLIIHRWNISTLFGVNTANNYAFCELFCIWFFDIHFYNISSVSLYKYFYSIHRYFL